MKKSQIAKADQAMRGDLRGPQAVSAKETAKTFKKTAEKRHKANDARSSDPHNPMRGGIRF